MSVVYRLAYQYENGEIEGFARSAMIADNAKYACVQAIKHKCAAMNESFREHFLICTKKKAREMKLTRHHMKIIRKDWQMNKRIYITAL